MASDFFRLNPNHALQSKQEHYQSSTHGDSLIGSGNTQFFNISESNPLLTQDRYVLGSFHHSGPVQSVSGLCLTPLNQSREQSNAPSNDPDGRMSLNCSIKPESQFNDPLDENITEECKQPHFEETGTWTTAADLDL